MIWWTEQAAEQLESIYSLTASTQNEHRASEIVERNTTSIGSLIVIRMMTRTSPLMHAPRERSVDQTPFTVAYVIRRHRIVVLAIYEGRTNVVQLTKRRGASRDN